MKKYKMEVLKASDGSFHFDDDYGYQDKEILIQSIIIDEHENLSIKFNQVIGEKDWTKAVITMINNEGIHSSTKEIEIGSVAEYGKVYSNKDKAKTKWLGISMFLKNLINDMVEIEIEFI